MSNSIGDREFKGIDPPTPAFSVRVKGRKFLERRAIRAQQINRCRIVPEAYRQAAKEHVFGGQAEKLSHSAMP